MREVHTRMADLRHTVDLYDKKLKQVDSEDLDKPLQRLKPSTKYSLFGVVNHVGNMQYGHYFSYALVDGCWYEFNDETATKIDQTQVETANAYMLFYRIN